MSVRAPKISKDFIVADDARTAATLSALLARKDTYLPVVDGPRMMRDDRDNEVIRRNNAAARCEPNRIFIAGVPDAAYEALAPSFPPRKTFRVAVGEVPDGLQARPGEPLSWGNDRIGIGLLKALQEGRSIEFDDQPSPEVILRSKSGHVVVCEAGQELSEVIAANYAHALNASLCVIPPISKETAEGLMERFYSLQEPSDRSPTQKLEEIKTDLRALCPGIVIPENGSITFISRLLPFGFAFPEAPSTHLFTYPDLGICIVHGFVAEANGDAIDVANLVDPGEAQAPEIAEVIKLLRPRNVFIRGYEQAAANVRDITDMVDLFPYDLLLFATHCGDAPGYRWTYEFEDSEGIQRRLVVDVAIGVGREDHEGLLSVMQFYRFHSLDGVRWMDPEKWEDFHVGTALIDWLGRERGENEMEPVEKEVIDRVRGSAALKMADHNYIPAPVTLACGGTPIIINNACVSWHELAGRFIYGGARAYVGCLVEVLGPEAHAVTAGFLGKHAAKFLPQALWSTQNHAFGDSVRRPYVVSGVYTQRLRWRNANVPLVMMKKIRPALADYTRKFEAELDGTMKRKMSRTVDFYKREIRHLLEYLPIV